MSGTLTRGADGAADAPDEEPRVADDPSTSAEPPEGAGPDADGEPVATTPAATGPATTADHGRSPALPWVVAAVAVLVAVVSTVMWLRADGRADELQAAEDDRTTVALAASELLTVLTTWDAVDLDRTLAEVEARGTDTLRQDVAELLGLEIEQTLRDLGAVSTGDVLDVFVQSLANGRAEVFAVVRQQVESAALDGTQTTFNYFDMRFLETDDGTWLADAVVLIDPSLGPPTLGLGG